MYFIEKIIKFYLDLKKKPSRQIVLPDNIEDELEDVVTCKHNFMPIDSTGKILACSKCGYVVKRKRLKKES